MLEVVEDHEGSAFRAVYTVKFAGAVYALHALQKKSKRGVKTPKADVDLIHKRLKAAEEHYEIRARPKRPSRAANLVQEVEPSSGNVFADLDVPDAAAAMAKAELARRVCAILSERKLTQAAAAGVLGIDQPKVSALVRGRLEGFSTDRLFRFLNALGQDVEIVIRPRRRGNAGVLTRVVGA